MKNGPTFHGMRDRQLLADGSGPAQGNVVTQDRQLSYRFHAHFHPFVGELIRRLIETSIGGLLDADTDYKPGQTLTGPDGTPEPRPRLFDAEFFAKIYQPSGLVDQPYPVKELDFAPSGAYSVYNWELFFHVPFTVAVHLSRNQRFADAQRWFHFLFDPTDSGEGPTPQRFWKVKPFHDTDVKLIEELLINLSSGADPSLRDDTIRCIEAWKGAPFRPHLVARYRHTAYMFKTVMAYIDNLLAWGDSLFREDTGESINEATQLYVLAANILGPRPQGVPKKGTLRPQTYASLRGDLDALGNALRTVETDLPFDVAPHPTDADDDDDRFRTTRSIGEALYFCVPRNDKLLNYWDNVADRLFKIRNSLNIQGTFRQLPLFAPPIDPALLARAVAAGVDIGAAVSGVNQPLPLVRFSFLVQKALEICQEVKSLGSTLLATVEKADGEHLTVLRAKHERVMLGLAEVVRYGQWQEAIKAREGLEKSLANVVQRFVLHERQLGRQESDITLPELEALDVDSLSELNLKAVEPVVPHRNVEVDIASGVDGISGGRKISRHEAHELNLLASARGGHADAAALDTEASTLGLIPQFDAEAEPLGVGVAEGFGGVQLSRMTSLMASASRAEADRDTYLANLAAKLNGFARREQDYAHQSNLAAGEITQIYKQLRAAQIREAVAEREWRNHQRQVRNAEEIEAFLADKTTNTDFYAWLKREVRGLYGQCYQLAFDIARKAERALQRELGDRNLTFLRFDHRSGREGLLAGEKLYLDVKRMEMAYHDLNRREYELTRHVSLLQVDPRALMELRATGSCTFTVPEALFDLDCPGHYFRRIRSVAVSLPAVTGPYVGVHCVVTLLKSTIRTSTSPAAAYRRDGAEDGRFEDHFGSMESIVTSSAQSDSGLFETNLRDERYLPFEGAGAESQWRIELPGEPPTFDRDTLADVVLHLRYTAREGGQRLRTEARGNLDGLMGEGTASGCVRLLSVRHEFPTEWAAFKGTPGRLLLALRDEHFPFWSRGSIGKIKEIELLARGGPADNKVTTAAHSGTLHPDSRLKDIRVGRLPCGELSWPPEGTLPLAFALDDNGIDDLWLAVTWTRRGTS